jgi:hypothetical protein
LSIKTGGKKTGISIHVCRKNISAPISCESRRHFGKNRVSVKSSAGRKGQRLYFHRENPSRRAIFQ